MELKDQIKQFEVKEQDYIQFKNNLFSDLSNPLGKGIQEYEKASSILNHKIDTAKFNFDKNESKSLKIRQAYDNMQQSISTVKDAQILNDEALWDSFPFDTIDLMTSEKTSTYDKKMAMKVIQNYFQSRCKVDVSCGDNFDLLIHQEKKTL